MVISSEVIMLVHPPAYQPGVPVSTSAVVPEVVSCLQQCTADEEPRELPNPTVKTECSVIMRTAQRRLNI